MDVQAINEVILLLQAIVPMETILTVVVIKIVEQNVKPALIVPVIVREALEIIAAVVHQVVTATIQQKIAMLMIGAILMDLGAKKEIIIVMKVVA